MCSGSTRELATECAPIMIPADRAPLPPTNSQQPVVATGRRSVVLQVLGSTNNVVCSRSQKEKDLKRWACYHYVIARYLERLHFR